MPLLLPLLLQMQLRRPQQLERRQLQIRFWVLLLDQEQQLGQHLRCLFIYGRRLLFHL